MSERYVHTGAEHALRVRGHPTSQEELRFDALHTQVHGLLVERGQASSILVLLDLLEAAQDLIEFLTTKGKAS